MITYDKTLKCMTVASSIYIEETRQNFLFILIVCKHYILKNFTDK